MHSRPCQEVVKKFLECMEESNRKAEIVLRNLEERDTYDAESIISLLIGGFSKGDEIEISARGDFSVCQLESWVERIGKVFTMKDNRPSLYE